MELNCYGDTSQFTFIPENFLHNWDLEKKIILFTLICSFVERRRVFDGYFYHLLANVIITYVAGTGNIFMTNLLLLGLAIVIEKFL